MLLQVIQVRQSYRQLYYTTGMSPIPNTRRKSDFGSFTHTLTCVGPGMQERTLSMFSEVTSTSSTATSASPEKNMQKVYIYQVNWLNQDKSSKFEQIHCHHTER